MSAQKRYRVLFNPLPSTSRQLATAHDHCFRAQGHGSELADTPEDALRRVATRASTPTEGRWLVLCETDGRWWEFTVTRRTELQIDRYEGVSAQAAA